MKQNTVVLADHLKEYLPRMASTQTSLNPLLVKVVKSWSRCNIRVPVDSKLLLDKLDRFLENHADELFVGQVGRWEIDWMEIHLNLPFGFTVVYRTEDHHNYGIRCAFIPVGTGVKVLGGVSYNQLIHIPQLSMYPVTAIGQALDYWGQSHDPYSPMSPESVHAYPWPDECFAYPIVEPVLDLKSENCTREYAMFTRITDYIKSRSYRDWEYLFNSGNACSDINAPRFRLRAHNYDATESDWNLVWRDVSISWYKHYNRSLRISRGMSDEELELMESEIMTFLETYDFPEADSTVPAPLTAEQIQAITNKVNRNGQSGAFGRGVGLNNPILTNSLYGSMGSEHSVTEESAEALANRLIPPFTDEAWFQQVCTSPLLKPNCPFQYLGITKLDGKAITDDEINVALRALRQFHSVDPLTTGELAVVAEAIQLLRKSQELRNDSES